MLGDSYRAVIETYLRSRAGAWFELTARNAAKNAIAELNALDAKRAKTPGKVLAVGAAEQLGQGRRIKKFGEEMYVLCKYNAYMRRDA